MTIDCDRAIDPADVGPMAGYFPSDTAQYVTWQCISVDAAGSPDDR
jgi:hypothetical protein